jgi:Tfp pilus assembly protein PilX
MVLLLCMIFLTAMMLLGLSASTDTILQSQLSSNLQETERARQNAQTTLIWAEQWLLKLESPLPENCESPCNPLPISSTGILPPDAEFKPYSWWQEVAYEAGTEPTEPRSETSVNNTSANNPLWLIEAIHSIPAAQDGSTDLHVWYRILARGSGRAGKVVAVVESLVVRPWPLVEPTEKLATQDSGICFDQAENCGRVSWRELR